MASSGKMKSWQILVLLLGVAAIGYMGFKLVSGGSSDALTSKIYAVDLVTGELFVFNVKKRAPVFPGKHPDTGVRSLLPVEQMPDESWAILERYIAVIPDLVEDYGVDPKAVADMRTGQMNTTGDSFRRVD